MNENPLYSMNASTLLDSCESDLTRYIHLSQTTNSQLFLKTLLLLYVDSKQASKQASKQVRE